MLGKKLVFAFALVCSTSIALAGEGAIEHYQTRYPLKTSDQKLVDNQGNGFEPLYGVRNFRAVLNGVVYRGGANNAYNKYGKRNNSNPLPTHGIQNLCEEGFSGAVYLYPTRFETAPHRMNCRTRSGNYANELRYEQESVLGGDHIARRILEMVYGRLQSNGEDGPIYLHCWNGWHASGYISSLILRQFCGFSGEQAVNYWDRNTDGNNKSSRYNKIRSRIRNFQPIASMQISAELQKQVCPNR